MGEFLSESEPRCTLQSLSRYEAGKGFPLPSLSQSMAFNVICSAEQIAIARILRAFIVIASGMNLNAAGGFLKTLSLEASEGGKTFRVFKVNFYEVRNFDYFSSC